MGSDVQPQFVAAMWLAMMAVMMVPTAVPAALRTPKKVPFFGAYLGVWAVFALAAAFVHFWLEQRELLTPHMALANHEAAGVLLIAIGAYQLSPWKRAWLRACHAAQVEGRHYSLACLGSSWALMGILFVGGVMNYAVIVGLALWITAEKYFPWGASFAAAGGIGLIAGGAITFLA